MSSLPRSVDTDSSVSSASIASIVESLRDRAPIVRQTTAEQRKEKIQRLADALLDHRHVFADALQADFGKHPVEVNLAEIKAVTKEAEHAVDQLDTWMEPDRIHSPFLFTGTRSEVHYEPKGVVLIMSPWNYPVNLTLGPLVGALAAGNCVVLKPSEHTPRTAEALKNFVHDLYDPREVRVVTGDADVAQTLTAQRFDHIYFTGSPAVGRLVMKAAAEHLTSVTLELGGKSPGVIDHTASLRQAAERMAWSKFLNAGQTCVAPDYLLVDRRVHDAVVNHLRDTIHRFYGETEVEQKESDDYARLVHDDHYDKIMSLLSGAVEAGATVAVGGQHDETDKYVAPTVLTDVPLDTALMQEEIFGPILPVIGYDSLNEAIDIINDRPPPLSLYVFADRDAPVDAVLNRTTAGTTCINEGFIHFLNPNLPFGGKGESGIGRGHGIHSFREFSNERSVLRRTYGTDLLQPLYPPYDRITSRVTDWVLRFF